MATDGLSLITLLYGCSTDSGHNSTSSSSGGDESRSLSFSQSGEKMNGQLNSGVSAMGMGRIVGGERRGGATGGGGGTEDDKTVEALLRSCNPSFIQKSFMLCKSALL